MFRDTLEFWDTIQIRVVGETEFMDANFGSVQDCPAAMVKLGHLEYRPYPVDSLDAVRVLRIRGDVPTWLEADMEVLKSGQGGCYF